VAELRPLSFVRKSVSRRLERIAKFCIREAPPRQLQVLLPLPDPLERYPLALVSRWACAKRVDASGWDYSDSRGAVPAGWHDSQQRDSLEHYPLALASRWSRTKRVDNASWDYGDSPCTAPAAGHDSVPSSGDPSC